MTKNLDPERMMRDVMGDLNAMQAANGALRRQVTECKNQQQQLLIVLAALVKEHHAGRVDVSLATITALPEDGRVRHWTSETEPVLCIEYVEPLQVPINADPGGEYKPLQADEPPKLTVLS